ncbi:MerR family transcriptional regulator [Roseovarius sp. 10]|jgi:DNA-binding transcriptional MerR regulator|uniref:MerR family transcriptional regulator n=1 Tax=Roseovarius sp. 10 TaxID=3080563 RepID=UPI0029544C7E|nr:MerR family transcriptional regulator [Roseovarius sp. 10]MDV7199818.1 MerR family transcriptional regulator [Roseovarius sp. 10]
MAKSPDAFRTIREVADWLGVAAHVLRFWESKFTQIKPVKRAGGRRYYRPADMRLIGGIKVLLHDEGMTIRGVQRLLREDGVAAVAARSPELDPDMMVAEAQPAPSIAEVAREAANENTPSPTPHPAPAQPVMQGTPLPIADGLAALKARKTVLKSLPEAQSAPILARLRKLQAGLMAAAHG